MKSTWFIFSTNVSPFLAAFLLILVAALANFENGTVIHIPAMIGSVEHEISEEFLARTLFVLAAAVCLCYASLRDYSRYFPTQFRVNVHFTDKEIVEFLSNLSENERKRLCLLEDWALEKRRYLRRLQDGVKQLLDYDFPFADDPDGIHAVGTTTFIVKKTGFLQSYRVDVAKGSLKHVYEVQGKRPRPLKSEFVLKNTAANKIKLSLADIVRRSTILLPEFRQVIWLTPHDEHYDHDLIAATRIVFFPVPQVGDSLYMVQLKELGANVPIGIAQYAFDVS